MQNNKNEKKRKICIVDDDNFILEIYGIKLRQKDFEVVTARNGREGFDVIKAENPDVAIIDIMMPEIDGVGLIQALRKDSNLSRIPVVVLTNTDSPEVLNRIKKLNIHFYIVKALSNPQKVVDIVEEVLQNTLQK
ncbi:MAG TPA: response regulator [Candidatus Moranbacteria bacterium]|nr:response regulator [Candidatus Moranbacteria bacterium]